MDLEKAKVIIEKVVSSEQIDLVDIEFKGSLNHRVLRIYIDKPGGIAHSDCELVSNHVGVLLDVEDVIPGSYTLEVSSPGLTRKLTKEVDFARFSGRLVKIQTKQPLEGRRNFRGILMGLEGETVRVELSDQQRVQIPLNAIAKANLDIDF